MQMIADLHTHTLCATHAFQTLNEMAAAAKDCGYKALAITDHAPAMPDAPHRWHFENPTALPRTIDGVVMLYGAEANVVDAKGHLDLPPRILEYQDWVVASIHSPCVPGLLTRKEANRNMKADGKAVIIITHKLHEVLGISDRVAILRKGEYVGDIATRDADEATLTAMMVGEKVELNIERPEPVNPVKRLDIQHLTVRSADGITVLDDASFDVYGGEILGIAGISGNGQKELLEAIAGLQPTQRGASVEYYAPDASAPVQLIGKSPKAIQEAGIHLSFVPEDRLGMGLVGSMGMTDNMMLKSYGKGHSPIVDRKAPHDLAETIKKELNVVTPDLNTPVSRLSGGNVQKVLVGRELAADPIVLMTAYAVRGLDINTSYTIYHLLNEQKKKGVAVIYVGEDLDVLLELCDRIVVLCGGKVNGILDGRKTTKEEVGNRMTNLVKEVKA